MPIGISPTVDFDFKLMLGSPEHPSITVHFLNAVLGGSPRITQVTIIDPILGKNTEDDKLAVLDVLAVDEFNRQINIEMQTSTPVGLSQRLLFYASCLYVDRLNEGDGYYALRSVMSICVLEQPVFPRASDLHLDFRLRDKLGQVLTDDLQIHWIELSKSQATEHNIHQVSALERWAFFFRNVEGLDAETARALLPEPEFDEAVGVLEMISRTPEQRRLYNARQKFLRDEASRSNDEATRLENARLEAFQEGEEVGVVIGELRGQIHLLERLLGLPQSTSDQLGKLDVSQLTTILNDMNRQLDAKTH